MEHLKAHAFWEFLLKDGVYTFFFSGALLNASLSQTGLKHDALAFRLEENKNGAGSSPYPTEITG
jgi:hypothetical protein